MYIIRRDNRTNMGYVLDESGVFIGIEDELRKTNPEIFEIPEPRKRELRSDEYSVFPYSPYVSLTGMSMREHYAALALVGIIHSASINSAVRPLDRATAELFANSAFLIAEAMVKRSEQR